MTALRTAVIGVGYLGRFHAQKYAALPDAELVAVVDRDAERARAVAAEVGCRALTDPDDLRDQVDAVSIVVPTRQHYAIAAPFLEAGTHVLIEKPVTVSVAEADALVALAARHGALLQVGHLERFNPAVLEVADLVREPMFIESHRIAPFNPRGADVSVVLDLMIHDIDLILELVDRPLARIDANGAPVISRDIDIANARLQFDNGCVANVTASRVSLKAERRMRIFQRNAYLALDMQARSVEIRRRRDEADADAAPTMADIEHEQRTLEPGDALQAEIAAFLDSIRRGTRPVVSGEDGRRALEAAIEISRQLRENPLPGQP
ncbi:Gfo/Idh/MocA family protein [Spiribacter halobius]|uniref:UDP-N-acetyl-D-glucosamine dehydrogenase n=1 Tax=Sediminicurvatus halobius TaxID=2182432 RepID=A0A2U2N483_9GAMM|nr:Gfo/Idh/MocA family oxidoreductase [Spiribacter halobius]PWG63920.1 UDP-N-acetyl-D-glucosamine dehydrogenase [Spiribacter halobius]UEX76333.1 Gfo/Idh/MocA family oxidoreductase [Spiribacter halobius]